MATLHVYCATKGCQDFDKEINEVEFPDDTPSRDIQKFIDNFATEHSTDDVCSGCTQLGKLNI